MISLRIDENYWRIQWVTAGVSVVSPSLEALVFLVLTRGVSGVPLARRVFSLSFSVLRRSFSLFISPIEVSSLATVCQGFTMRYASMARPESPCEHICAY
jgi:hypothetical protein